MAGSAPHRHQVLDLEDDEVRLGKPVLLGVEQSAERTFQRVVAQRRADRLVLHLRHEMRQRAVIRRAQQQHRPMDRLPARPVTGGRPACSSKQVAIQSSAQARSASVSRTASGQKAGPTAVRRRRRSGGRRRHSTVAHMLRPLSKAQIVTPRIAQSLQCHGAEQGGLAGAGRPEDQRMADVADVQVDPEGRGAGRGGVQERRRAGCG